MTKKSQSGRSMIEMLGVLAIIGVLSIGGLAGYTRAMLSYHVNEILDYTNRCWADVRSRGTGGGAIARADCSTFIADAVPAGANSIQCSRTGINAECVVTINDTNLKKAFATKIGQPETNANFIYTGTSWGGISSVSAIRDTYI